MWSLGDDIQSIVTYLMQGVFWYMSRSIWGDEFGVWDVGATGGLKVYGYSCWAWGSSRFLHVGIMWDNFCSLVSAALINQLSALQSYYT